MIKHIWILTKKDYKEIFTNHIQFLIVLGYLIFINILPLIDSNFHEGMSINTILFSVGISALFPIFNVLIQAFSRERKNKVLDLLLVKISPLSVCINKLLTSISMSVLFAIFSFLMQTVIFKIYSPDKLSLFHYLLDLNLPIVIIKFVLPIIIFISFIGIIISVFLDDNIKMYAYAIILLLFFGVLRVLINGKINIFNSNYWWIPLVLWIICIIPLSFIIFMVDKEKMLKA